MPNELQKAGSMSQPTKFGVLHQDRFITGLWTQRSPLRDAASPYLQARFYGSRFDSLWDGSNVEISSKLTLQRRPGLASFNASTFNTINRFYSFRYSCGSPLQEHIKVMADTSTTVYVAATDGVAEQTNIFTKSAGAGKTSFLAVGNVLYMANGVDLKKFNIDTTSCAVGTVFGWGTTGPANAPGDSPTGHLGDPCRYWGPSMVADVGYAILDSNGNVELMAGATSNATNATATLFPTTLLNGWGANAHVGDYEGGVNQGHQTPLGLNASTTLAYNNPSAAYDGSNDTAASCSFSSTHQYAGCVWSFSYALTKINITAVTRQASSNVTTYTYTVVSGPGVVNQTVITISGCTNAGNNGTFTVTAVPGTGGAGTFDVVNAAGVTEVGSSGTATNGNSPSALTLKVLSEVPSGSGTRLRDAGVWYSLDGGANWTKIYQATGRAKQWDSVTLLATQDINQVQVMAFTDSHDNMAHNVYEINIIASYSSATLSLASTGNFKTGTSTPKWNTTVTGNTIDNAAIWQCMGPPTTWVANNLYTPDANSLAIIDSSGNWWVAQQTGMSGSTIPAFTANEVVGTTLTDNTVTWLNVGPGQGLAFSSTGWSWVYCYVQSAPGDNAPTAPLALEVSTASPASVSTGPVVGIMGPVISGVGSSDPKIDKIWIFRTLDGGASYLFDAEIANPGGGVTWTYKDTNLDSALNEFILAPTADVNNPPPAGLTNLAYHLGVIWGSVGNSVYYSRTNSSTAGPGTSSFPPLNVFTFPSAVTRLWPTAQGMVVFTVSDVYLILGQNTTSSPLYPVPHSEGLGLLSYDAMAVNGSIAYLFTADRQFVEFNPTTGVQELGFPIGDKLEAFNPQNAYVTFHVAGSQDRAVYVADGSTGWYRLNPTAAPENGFTWSPFATITGGCAAVQSIETTPGTKQLLVGPTTSGPILARNLTVFTDNGTPYTANAVIGSIELALPGQLSEIRFITTDATAVGTPLTLGVRMDEISGAFTALTNAVADPPQLVPSSSTQAKRFYFSQTQTPAWCRHMMLQINWIAENAKNELLSFTLFGASTQEK